MKKLHYLFLLVVFISPFTINAQLNTHTFAQVDSLQKVHKKNTVVFIHTDWCKYCLAMENTVFKDDEIIELLNQNFLFVDLNAEEKNDIVFAGYNFQYKPTGRNTGVNELAEQLGEVNGKVAYPTLCILNPDNEIIFQYNQYLPADYLKDVLTQVLNLSR